MSACLEYVAGQSSPVLMLQAKKEKQHQKLFLYPVTSESTLYAQSSSKDIILKEKAVFPKEKN